MTKKSTNSSELRVNAPEELALIQVGHAVINTLTLDRDDTSIKVGLPYTILVIDVQTRFIVGLFVVV